MRLHSLRCTIPYSTDPIVCLESINNGSASHPNARTIPANTACTKAPKQSPNHVISKITKFPSHQTPASSQAHLTLHGTSASCLPLRNRRPHLPLACTRLSRRRAVIAPTTSRPLLACTYLPFRDKLSTTTSSPIYIHAPQCTSPSPPRFTTQNTTFQSSNAAIEY